MSGGHTNPERLWERWTGGSDFLCNKKRLRITLILCTFTAEILWLIICAMKGKRILLAAVASAALAAIHAEGGLQVSLIPVYIRRTSMDSEYLYQTRGDKSQGLKSRLDWNNRTSAAGLQAELSAGRFTFSATAATGFHNKAGGMEDSDWLDLNGTKNILSRHTNAVEKDVLASAEVRFKFKPFNRLIVEPSVGVSYRSLHYHASNGYGWYGDAAHVMAHTGKFKNVPYDSADALYIGLGNIRDVEYERDEFSVTTGLRVSFLLLPRLRLFIHPSVSPLTRHTAIDTHHTAAGYRRFKDTTSGTFASWSFMTGGELIFSRRTALIITYTLQQTDEIRGTTYTEKDGGWEEEKDYTVASSSRCHQFAAGIKVNIF